MKCLSKNCAFERNPNVSNNGGNYCCRTCKTSPNKHGAVCQRKLVVPPSAPVPVVPPTIESPKGLKRALLIGINYLEDPNNTLSGCINDVKNVEAKLRTANPECKEFRILTDEQADPLLKPTRKNVVDGLNWLVNGIQTNESVFFHYSGHGGLTVDFSGDEQSGFDSCIYPINNGKIEMITDDELRVMFVDKMPTGSKGFAVLDCCHSGSALDLRYLISAPQYGQINITQNTKYPKANGSVIFLSGCTDNQTAADTVDSNNIPSGALTNALLEVWNQYGMNIKFKYLLWDVRDVLKKNGYSQIPQMACSSDINIGDTFKL